MTSSADPPAGAPRPGLPENLGELLNGLATALSPGAVLTTQPLGIGGQAGALSSYEVPFRGPAGRAVFVVRPRTLDEVRLVLAWAVRHRIALLPQGARTGLVGAGTPEPTRPQGVLSTDRLVEILQIAPHERAVTASAGVRLSAIAAAAAEHGLEPAVDLGSDPSVGGMVATNAGGCRVMRQGDVRQQILGVQGVLAVEGTPVIGELRPLRKNNTGPRGADLLIGSGGQFGVITAATLALVPIPLQRAVAMVELAPEAPLAKLVSFIEASWYPLVSATEFISAQARALVIAHTGARDPLPFAPAADVVMVEFSGPGATTCLEAAAAGLIGADLVLDAHWVPTSAAWALRHAIGAALNQAGDVIGLDVSVPRSALTAVLQEVRTTVRTRWPEALLADFGHIGDGGLHLNLVVPPVMDVETRHQIREWVYDVIARHGGSFSAEHGLGPVTLDRWRRSTSAGDRELAARLKAALDPYGLLGSAQVSQALTR